MYLGIYSVVCCAILAGFATTAEKTLPRNSDITFPEGDAIEGSGNDAEVNHDLESSGSGFGGIGVDDEDTIISTNTNVNTEKRKKDSKKTDVYSKNDEILTNAHDIDNNNNNGVLNQPQSTPVIDTDVIKMNPRPEDKERSFFAQPGILAAVIGGAVVGLLCAILVVMFIVYRMRKKDEGSYALGEPKQSPTANSYSRGNNKEFYA